MTILVTGATGRIGREVVAHLAAEGAATRAMTRDPQGTTMPDGVSIVGGSVAEPDDFRRALDGVSTLFLLVPNVADELTQAMLALDLARDAGVKGIVYLSVFRGAEYADVPHFAGKATVERMIAAANLPATVLRPAYFMQNDLQMRDALLGGGIYPMPIGHRGLSMIDGRDVGLAAARALLRREQAPGPLPAETHPLVGPDSLDGPALAALWGEALHRTVSYGGDDLEALEQRLRGFAPSWLARELRLMMRRYQEDGAVASADEVAATTRLLGRAPKSYRAFAAETAAVWQKH